MLVLEVPELGGLRRRFAPNSVVAEFSIDQLALVVAIDRVLGKAESFDQERQRGIGIAVAQSRDDGGSGLSGVMASKLGEPSWCGRVISPLAGKYTPPLG